MALGFGVGPWRETWATPSLVPSFPIAPSVPAGGVSFSTGWIACRSLLSAPLPTSGTWTFASVVPKREVRFGIIRVIRGFVLRCWNLSSSSAVGAGTGDCAIKTERPSWADGKRPGRLPVITLVERCSC